MYSENMRLVAEDHKKQEYRSQMVSILGKDEANVTSDSSMSQSSKLISLRIHVNVKILGYYQYKFSFKCKNPRLLPL